MKEWNLLLLALLHAKQSLVAMTIILILSIDCLLIIRWTKVFKLSVGSWDHFTNLFKYIAFFFFFFYSIPKTNVRGVSGPSVRQLSQNHFIYVLWFWNKCVLRVFFGSVIWVSLYAAVWHDSKDGLCLTCILQITLPEKVMFFFNGVNK